MPAPLGLVQKLCNPIGRISMPSSDCISSRFSPHLAEAVNIGVLESMSSRSGLPILTATSPNFWFTRTSSVLNSGISRTILFHRIHDQRNTRIPAFYLFLFFQEVANSLFPYMLEITPRIARSSSDIDISSPEILRISIASGVIVAFTGSWIWEELW